MKLLKFIFRFVFAGRLKCDKKEWMNSEEYCWHCGKIIPCECMDATCWVCGRPFSKERCAEFGFNSDGSQVRK
jgi:hypothetical protein